ncbi:MAG: DUF342 domain-containing protein [Planctomycetes bacterium]|nr:DUF342 domain-containing protein [Planctomycetota bacterium]
MAVPGQDTKTPEAYQQGTGTVQGLNLEEHTVFFSSETGGKRLVVYTDKAKLHAYLYIQPTSPYFEISFQEVEAAIDNTGIAVSQESMAQINEHLGDLREALQSGQPINNPEPILISQGKPAEDGTDGFFEWFINEPDPNKLRFNEDPVTGSINFRELNLVINVNQDDPLVQVHEPSKGEPGYDVFGSAIPARHGERVRLGKGKGVRFDENEGIMYAEHAGHVENKNGTLNVSPVYLVHGDVDFSVGNINFNGAVIVTKDVNEGFQITTTEGIKVEGMVSASTLISEGDIEVLGGITCNADGPYIETKRRLLAKYLMNLKVDTQGDILVETQIVNCKISTAGKLIMPAGNLVGGETVALGGVEAKVIGAPAGTRTVVVVSIDSFTTAETRAIEAEITAKEKLLQMTEQLLGPFIKDRSLLNELPPAKMDQVLQHIREMDNIHTLIAQLHDERAKALQPYMEAVSDEVIVHKAIHAGTDLRIDNARQVFAESIAGPIRLRPNYERGTISIQTLI